MEQRLIVAITITVLFITLIGYSKLDRTRVLEAFLSPQTQPELNMTSEEWMGMTNRVSFDDFGSSEIDLIRDGLPGQPKDIKFKQYSGYIRVDDVHGRTLFYYFVEASHPKPTSKPLVLWLNGGPGCSSLGNGALVENGPFGVQNDGMTLYSRRHSWNKVANVLYLESPTGVGFSYSNTTSDYNTTGDLRTAQDSYIFLVKWFKRFSHYKRNDFYIMGESYAGFFIPELADIIIHKNIHAHSSSGINLQGVMIGNGLLNDETDRKGIYDYIWSHALISDETYKGLIETCIDSKSKECVTFQKKAKKEKGNINMYDLYGNVDPFEKDYVRQYLNLPHVQEALHANDTNLPYPWGPCSLVIKSWRDSPSTMFPAYRRLIAARIRIHLYSGDSDAVIPVTSTRLSVNAMNLTIKNHWRPWIDNNKNLAGYQVDYEGLTVMTVLGAGHEVPRHQPWRAFSMVKIFLDGN